MPEAYPIGRRGLMKLAAVEGTMREQNGRCPTRVGASGCVMDTMEAHH